ncbi:MAG: methyltransferase domain-containing protein [Clostridia bacterium]|nr:methyltransferase domain-containing protein [Clostridia bacterium]
MLPSEFLTRMKDLLGDDYDAFIRSYDDAPVRSFRINTNKISEEDFLKINPFGGEKLPFAENAYYFDYEKIGNHPYHHAGMVYVQEPAAMSAVASVDIEEDWKILDLCAAPGGKSTQAADKLTNGMIVSNEIVPSRCKILTGNMERLGFKNAVTTCADAKRLSSLFGEEFDLVIVDAPCSGEGMFRKDETAINEWSPDNVRLCAERQEEILSYIHSLVREDGYLLYSTCTFSLEENEMQVDKFLCEHPEFELIPVKDCVKSNTADGINFEGCKTENIAECRRFYPHVSKGEGQFVALMKKKFGNGIRIKRENALEEIPKNEQKIVFDFLDATLEKYDRKCVKKYKDSIVYFEPDFVVPKGVAFSCGVTIGTVQKNYVQPHHQFFMAMGDAFKRKIDLTPDEAETYLKGNTIPCDCENGWAVVTVDGCTLGGAKAVNGTAKNHYPKGLRKV